MHFNTFKNTLHLSPDENLGGGAAAAGSPAGGAAPADTGFDASAFVPREDFDRISNDYSEFRNSAEQRFQDYDSRLPKAAASEPKSDKAPSPSDYDFSKEGQFEAFMDARADFLMEKKFADREKSYSESQREQGYKQYVQTAQNSHSDRADSFRAANPEYDPNKSIVIGNEAVGLAVLESDYSAHIHNYLQKNPDKTKELQKLATTNPAAAIRMVGRIESQFETKAPSVPGKKAAASAQTTAGAFGGPKPSGKPEKSLQEIYDKFNS